MKKNEYIEYDFILEILKPNSRKIFNEIILAKKNKMWACVIVFSMTILDNIFSDDETFDIIDGLDINKLKFSNEIRSLRKKRNQLLHYEDNEISNFVILNDKELKKNAVVAYDLLVKTLMLLFSKKH